jgi:uncharacterized delta-60 repeat protein
VAVYPQVGTPNDGKIVVGGFNPTRNGSEFALVRYNLDGSEDKSFGGSGEVLGGPPGGWAQAVAIQKDGKVLAAGTIFGPGDGDFALLRYNADGSVDKTFGTRGVAKTAITPNCFDAIMAMALQGDKIVVAGWTRLPSNTSELVVARYNANGTLDSSFGKAGLALDHLAVSFGWARARSMNLVIDPGTGAIVVSAAAPPTAVASSMPLVVRYTSSGILDTSFAGAGYETLPAFYGLAAVAIQADHKIVVAGRYAAGGFEGLERLNADGSLDTNFGSGGIELTSIPLTINPTSVKFAADGTIVVGASGSSSPGSKSNIAEFMVTRFDANSGSLDTSFGTAGVAMPALPTGGACNDMTLEPDGRMVLVGIGTATGSNIPSWVVTRFLAAGPQIGSFGASSNPVTAGASVTLTASTITDANPNSTITQVAFYYFDSGGIQQLLGYATQTSPGVWSLTVTANLSSGSHTLFAQAADSYGVFGDLATLNFQVL